MQYLRNFELLKLYPVSEGTVRNWIARARDGRLDLQLYENEGKTYVANTADNIQRIEQLIRSRRKYLRKRDHKLVTPMAEFYELYSPRQVLDIVSNLDVHREIPRQYNYFDGGANHWDAYVQRLYHERSANLVNGTVWLLDTNMPYLGELLKKYKHVNVIDVGVGNAWPTKNLLAHLLETGKLGRYIAVDISAEMLQLAESYIKEWFGGQVPFECFERDISHDWFTDLLAPSYLGSGAEETINLVLLLGATPVNFRSPADIFKVVYNSMGRRDLLVYTTGLDALASRRTFSFNTGKAAEVLPPQYKFIVDLLGIDESSYEVKLGFDERRMERYVRIRLTTSLTLCFKFETGERVIELDKGEDVLVWRAKHQSTRKVLQQLEDVGFSLLAAVHTEDYLHLLTIAGIRAAPNLSAGDPGSQSPTIQPEKR